MSASLAGGRVERASSDNFDASPAKRGDPPLPLVSLTVMLGVIMAIIDTSIVNVALNDMAGTLGASVDEIAWVATGYILATVIVMPLNGWLTARFGRKRFYATCLVIFTVASFLCGTATSLTQIVFYRVIQGFGGGALQPTAQAIMFESYPPNRRAGAMAIFGLGAMVGPAIGPTLGGYIVDNYSWPLIFFINIPIGITAFLMTMAFIRDPDYVERHTGSIDFIGLGLLAAGVGSLQYVLERGERLDWFSSGEIDIFTAISLLGIGFFIWRQLSERNPLVDLRVFANRAFTAGNLIGIVTGFGLYGTALILPLFFQNVLGFTATETGVALLPGALATAISMPLASTLVRRVDGRFIIVGGLVLFAIGSWQMGGLNQFAGYWDVFWDRSIQGFAMGFIFVPLSTATLGEVSREKMANATGLYTLLRQLGGSVGIAILEFMQQRYSDGAYAGLASSVTAANPAVQRFVDQLHGSPTALWQMIMVNATVLSYDSVLRLCAIVFVVSIPLVFLLSGRKAATGEQPHVAAE